VVAVAGFEPSAAAGLGDGGAVAPPSVGAGDGLAAASWAAASSCCPLKLLINNNSSRWGHPHLRLRCCISLLACCCCSCCHNRVSTRGVNLQNRPIVTMIYLG
jgi:hypothetical protein